MNRALANVAEDTERHTLISMYSRCAGDQRARGFWWGVRFFRGGDPNTHAKAAVVYYCRIPYPLDLVNTPARGYAHYGRKTSSLQSRTDTAAAKKSQVYDHKRYPGAPMLLTTIPDPQRYDACGSQGGLGTTNIPQKI